MEGPEFSISTGKGNTSAPAFSASAADGGYAPTSTIMRSKNVSVKCATNIELTGNTEITGSFSVTGSKNRIVKTQNYGDRLQYCYEMATPMFGDIGEAQTDENGLEKRTISIAVLDYVTDEEFQNPFHQFFKEKFNVDWDYNYVEWGSWDEILRVWINADDLPDVSIWNYNYQDFENYVNQGLLYRFPDDWKERWPNAAMAYEKSPLNIELEERFGGTYIMLRPIYVYNATTDPIVNQIGVAALRKDWAEAVGFPLKDAYTVEETLEYARLIKENDPGNIGSGLIPLCLDPTNAMYHFVTSQCNHAAPETAIYKNEDGVYVWGPAGEDVYEALKIYQDAYKEGLLDPEFYLMNDDDKERFYINGTAAMYQMGGVAEFRQTCDTEMNNNLGIDSDEAVHNAIVLGNDGKYHNLILGSNYWSSLIFSPP